MQSDLIEKRPGPISGWTEQTDNMDSERKGLLEEDIENVYNFWYFW